MLTTILKILIQNRGEILDRRLEELLKKEFPYITALSLEEVFMKLESENIIHVFRVAKNKKMIVLNKYNKILSQKVMKELS